MPLMRPKLLRFVLFITPLIVCSSLYSQNDEFDTKPRLQFLTGYGIQALQGNIGSPIDEITRFIYIQNQNEYTLKEEKSRGG